MAIQPATFGTVVEQTANSTPTPIPYPSVVNPTDMLILCVGSGNSTPLAAIPTSDWTLITQLSNSSGTLNPCAGAWYKLARGDEAGGNLSLVHGSFISAQILAFTGVDPANPLDGIAPTTFDSGATTQATADMPSLTVITGGSALVTVAATSNTTTQTVTPAAGYTETADRTVSGARSWEVAYELGEPNGATGIQTVTFSSNSARVVGLLFALRPATPAPTADTSLSGGRRLRRRR